MSREDHDHLSTADLAGTDPRLADRPAPGAPQQVRQEVRPGQQELPQSVPPREAQAPDMRMRDGQMQDPREAQAREAQGRATTMPGQPAPGSRPAVAAGHEMEQLAALFPPQMAAEFRNHWDQVQIGFVDDPRRAVQQADELVAQVMKSLATSFAEQRSRLEAGLGKGDQANTENLRMALRGYRSFFQRLLSL